MRILFETGNPGKLKEVRETFGALGHEVVQFRDEYPEIQTDDLEDVVVAGLKWLWEKHGKPMMIDDSGLFVDSLGGFPGVYSAYVFKTIGCRGILRLLEEVDEPRAEFRCCAGYVGPDGGIITRTGIVRGVIARRPAGAGGFGFDPIFVPEGYEVTFAQMSTGQKNSISHRGRAFSALADALAGEE